jgi:pyruvoyl-dependent arginine decarboxylase (PvlArgDC)
MRAWLIVLCTEDEQMSPFNIVRALSVAAAFAVMALPVRTVFAQQPSNTTAAEVLATVVVTASREPECTGFAPDEARQHAEQARREGAHRKAADCFRVAGDLVQADRASIRASADTAAETSRKAAASAETAKLQARRLREAFR